MSRSPLPALRAERLGSLPWILVTLSVMLVTASFLVLALSYAVYAERAAGDAVRYPMSTAEAGASTVTLLLESDHLPDREPYWVVYLQPDGPQAPLPPGLPKWLEPGQVALSPELAAAAAEQGISDLHGDQVAMIGRGGLSAADEKLAYVGADLDGVPGAYPYASFGADPAGSAWDVSSSGAIFGESMQVTSLIGLWVAIIVLSLAPSVLGLAVVSRFVRYTRARRDLLLVSLGAPRLLRRQLQVRVTRSAIAAGVVLGTVATLTPVLLGVRVPITRFLLTPELAWSHPWAIAAGVLVSVAVAVLLICRLPATARTTNRPAEVVQTANPWWILAGPIAVLVATRGPDLLDPGRGWTWSLTYWAGVLAVFALVPISIAIATTKVAAALQAVARRRSMPAAVVSLGWIAHTPLSALRIAAGFTLMFGVMFQATAATQGTSEDLRASLVLQDVIDGRLVSVRAYTEVPAVELTDVIPGTALVGAEIDLDNQVLILSGDCDAFTALSLPCDEGPLPLASMREDVRAAAQYEGATSGVTRVVSPDELGTDEQAWWFRLDGQRFDAATARQAAIEALGPRVAVEEPGDGWIVGAVNHAQEGKWVPVLASLGLSATLLALIIDLLGRTREHSRRAAMLTTLVGTRRHIWAMAGVIATVPLLVAAVLAFFAHTLVIAPMTIAVPPTPTPAQALLPLIIAGLLPATLASWLLIARSSLEASNTWVARGESTD